MTKAKSSYLQKLLEERKDKKKENPYDPFGQNVAERRLEYDAQTGKAQLVAVKR